MAQEAQHMIGFENDYDRLRAVLGIIESNQQLFGRVLPRHLEVLLHSTVMILSEHFTLEQVVTEWQLQHEIANQEKEEQA